jgi:predicted amidohydrolase
LKIHIFFVGNADYLSVCPTIGYIHDYDKVINDVFDGDLVMSTFLAACIQNTATRDIAANISWVCERIGEAAAAGADFIALPESVGLIEPDNLQIPENCFHEDRDAGLAAFRAAAKEFDVWILVGSQLIKDTGDSIVNRSLLLDAQGEVAARYDKLHMFDIHLSNGEIYSESDVITAGERAVVAGTPWGRVGMTICYDLRFAALYRALAKAGAAFITIPAAFTQTTGEAHWHTLVRARAIETGSYIIAPNQCGLHVEKRASYGHSLIVDPWGYVIADGGHEPGIIMAEIDLSKVETARRRIPALQHDRPIIVEHYD